MSDQIPLVFSISTVQSGPSGRIATGWVDFHFGCFTLSLVLLGELAELVEKVEMLVEHHLSDQMGHPVLHDDY